MARRSVSFIIALGLIAGLAGAESHLEAIRARGTLIMLCWPHQESTFVRRMVPELGAEGLNRFTGSDVELMRAFAEDLGVTLEIRPVREGFGGLIPALLAGDGDLIASSMTITPSRAEKVDFSAPYHSVKAVIVARRDSGMKSLEDLHGKTAAVVPGGSHEEHLRRLGFADLKLAPVDFMLESYQAVADEEADLTLVDSGSAASVLPKYTRLREQLEIAFEFPARDEYGIAVPPGSDLLPALDAFLRAER